MIKCSDYENNPCSYDHCCVSCIEKMTCKNVCELVRPDDTEETIYQECENASEYQEVITLEKNYPTLVEAITDVCIRKKQLEEEEKQMKEMLKIAMEACHLKSWDSNQLKVTYIAPTTRKSIDTTKLKKDLPDIAEQYTKESQVSASVRITVK